LSSAFQVGNESSDDGVHDSKNGDEHVRALAGAEGCQDSAEHNLGQEQSVGQTSCYHIRGILGV
jgi:hypothetical protein